MTRALDVWWDRRLVGQLTQNEHGELGFAYAPEWVSDDTAHPLSASLPKRAEPFKRRECRPFFGGLLPEEGQRDAAAQALGVSRSNDFALLDRLGGDVAGALQLLPPGETPSVPVLDQPSAPLDEAGLIRVLDALPLRPLLAGEDGLRLSLAGAQSKVPVVLVDGKVALPAPGQPILPAVPLLAAAVAPIARLLSQQLLLILGCYQQTTVSPLPTSAHRSPRNSSTQTTLSPCSVQPLASMAKSRRASSPRKLPHGHVW